MVISGQLRLVRRSMFAGMFLLLAIALVASPAWSQSLTTGGVSGKITDQTGAVVGGAKVTATSLERGASHSTVSEANGNYLIALLEPGSYSVTVEKSGFQTVKQDSITVEVSVNSNLPFKLTVGASSQTIEVSAAPPLIEPDNPNTHLTLTATQIENTPNPGGDITALASLMAGAQIGRDSYFTGQFNGLPAQDVGFEMDGADDNDSFLNNNASGPTDLLLGANTIAEVSVNTNAYDVTMGRFASGNVTYISKSGSNGFHGNLQYQWNGRALNAYDFFSKALPLAAGTTIAPKPFDNVNNWAGSVGGPIIKNKLFFFFDNEGTRIDLPESTGGTLPTPAFETYAAAQLALGGCDTSGAQNLKPSSPAVGASAKCEDPQTNGNVNYERYLPPETGANANGINELPFMQHIFSLYNGAQGTTAVGTYGKLEIEPDTTPQNGCPLLASGAVDPSYNPQLPYTTSKSASASAGATSGTNPIPADTGCRYSTILNTSNYSPETLTDFRMDLNANDHNTYWWRFYNDQGIQPSGTSALGNPLLNETSWQPNRQGYFDWTHSFSPTLVNDFHPSFQWYGAIFYLGNAGVNDESQVNTLLDGLGDFTSPFTSMGSNSFPQGRNVTQWELVDDWTWTHGSHSVKWGVNYRRLDIADYDQQGGTFPNSGASSIQEFAYGVASSAGQSFPTLNVNPVRIWELDTYLSDTWQIRPDLTMTVGLRATHNSNINDPYGDFVNIDDWNTFTHGDTPAQMQIPLSQTLATGKTFFTGGVPELQWQPRLALAWQRDSKTLIKAGWGMFSQSAAGSAADNLLGLAPADNKWSTGSSSTTGGYGSAAGCGLNVPQSALAGILQECYNLLDPGQTYSGVAAARYAQSTYLTNFAAGNPSCGYYSAEGLPSPTTCVNTEAASPVYPSTGEPAQYIYQYSLSIQRQFGRNTSVQTGYVGNHANNNSYSVSPMAYQSVCNGCFAPFPFAGIPGGANAVGSTTLTGCAVNNLCDADPRFSSFSQTEFGGGSRYDSLQTTFSQRITHGATLNVNWTWSHCLNTNTPYTLTSGTTGTWRDCTQDTRHVINAVYSYNLPFNAKDRFLAYVANGWQVSGATYFESGAPVFPGGKTGDSQFTTGPTSGAIPIPGVNPYSINTTVTALGPSSTTPTTLTNAGSYQWFNPEAFAAEYDSNTSMCYSPGTGTPSSFENAGSEGVNTTLCQYPNTYGLTLRGPWFNWTNFYATKQVKLTERLSLRFDAQMYNLFNHNNLSTPSLTGAIFQPGTFNANTNPGSINSTLTGGTGAITSSNSPPTSLLGSGLSNNTAARMIAFQGRFTF